ncbi:MAG: GNAT family N-acetyltransferase [Smithellaceae bacterium]|nr:GNAT family N-acetyltransferase [Syntrophaceae bacterium]MDD4241506.1 GNAT family N-acetyltransferase [Smithellaceae bacterium]NLX53122.1 GNAT family N-acetyltransferase [Deltaproteobacteria bacterium]
MNDYSLEYWKSKYPEKFADEDDIFRHIHRGGTIFVSSACAEPQYLLKQMVAYAEAKSRTIFDAEIIHMNSLGIAPYTGVKFKRHFRHNSFFISNATRAAVNEGRADYTPISWSQAPDLFNRGLMKVDVALIQTSPPDEHGFLSLGISVDIGPAALENASCVIAQMNTHMPRVHGNAFVSIDKIDYIIPHDEPLLEYAPASDTEVVQRIGKYIARLVEDGDTIQAGYGKIPNAILPQLSEKKHLGVHTEFFGDGLVDLIRRGVVDNTRKTINRNKTIASFCMGHRDTYEFINNNPSIAFRPIDYTNNLLIIAQHDNMVAINSALEIDLTGQSTATSIGRTFYSGVGGHNDFMRGAALSRNGKPILALQSTAAGGTVSRITPSLTYGAGASLTRSDVYYVVTEYGIAYLHGKNIRERAMELISIAHPKFRAWLIEEAKKANLIYSDQAYIPGEKGRYPEELETYRTIPSGTRVFFRPIKISDENRLQDFLYSLSDNSLYRRFISKRKDLPHERIQEFVVIDYTKETAIAAIIGDEKTQRIVGVGRYFIDESRHVAEVAFVVRDDYVNQGIGTELLSYLTYLAKRQGLLGFTADVLAENHPMLHVFEKGGFDIVKHNDAGVYNLTMTFKK